MDQKSNQISEIDPQQTLRWNVIEGREKNFEQFKHYKHKIWIGIERSKAMNNSFLYWFDINQNWHNDQKKKTIENFAEFKNQK